MDSVEGMVSAGRAALDRADLQAAWNHAQAARDSAIFDARPLYLMAEILVAAGRYGQARAALGEAASISPRSPRAVLLAAEIEVKEGQFAQALTLLATLADRPEEAERIHRAWLFASFGLGDYDTAADRALKVLLTAPHDAEVLSLLVGSLKANGRSREAIDAIRAFQSRSADPDSVEWLAVAPSLYAPTPPEEVFESHRRFARYGSRSIPRVCETYPNPRDPARPIRIGYYNPEYWGRWMPRFIHPWLSRHDLNDFAVTLYASGNPAHDERSAAAFKGMTYRNLWAVDDEAAARAIAADQVDILIDLAGLTATGRPGVLARKPAPIVVTWLGYPATTGLDAVDYRIVDAVTDPPGAERYATEALWRLDPCFLCFRFPDGLPDPSPPPSAATGRITFGSFNVLDKAGDHAIAVWAAIMREVEGSAFVMKNSAMARPAARKRVSDQFAAHGISPDRILLRPETATDEEHFAAYSQVDIALDTFPYNGTTTTADALWMGVPVVTFAGDSHVSRVGASMLTAAGLQALVAPTQGDFVPTAVELARDRGRLALLRKSLRGMVAASPLCDDQGFARKLEHSYRTMWRRYCGVSG